MNPLRVVHLEDDELDAELIAAHLETPESRPVVIRVASRAEFALALAEEQFDLILADYSLPSFDGMSALDMVREREIIAPFVFVSGALGEELAIESLKRGATDYVLKTNLGRLRPAVDRALREAGERAARLASEAERDALLREKTRVAETLQRSLLLSPGEVSLPGMKFSCEYESAWDEASIGGDFYDVFRIDDDRVAFVIGDVTGKGLRAATHTAEVKFALRGFMREDADPGRTLSRLCRFLVDSHRLDNQEDMAFVSMLLLAVDRRTGAARAASAGADPPLILRAGGAAETIPASGLLLGADRDVVYENFEFTLMSGDTVLAVTDGITEARRGREFFGFDGFTEAARQALPLGSLEAMGKAIVVAAKQFSGTKLHDDVCLLLIRMD